MKMNIKNKIRVITLPLLPSMQKLRFIFHAVTIMYLLAKNACFAGLIFWISPTLTVLLMVFSNAPCGILLTTLALIFND
jgi:hypothetical protein